MTTVLEEYENVKAEVKERAKTDEFLFKAVSNYIEDLEEQVKGYPALMKRAAKLESENMILQEKVEGSLIDKTKVLMDYEDMREKARLYARENEIMTSTNKDLKEIAEELRRENIASRALLKEVL